MIDTGRVQNLTLQTAIFTNLGSAPNIFLQTSKPVQEWSSQTCFSNIQLNFIFADKSVFSPLCSQLFSQDLSRSCNILPLVNITRPCNPAIIQPLTRHSQDLNIIESPCFLSSHWPQLSLSFLSLANGDSWWRPWHVTIVSRALRSTWWWGSAVTSRSPSHTMNRRLETGEGWAGADKMLSD